MGVTTRAGKRTGHEPTENTTENTTEHTTDTMETWHTTPHNVSVEGDRLVHHVLITNEGLLVTQTHGHAITLTHAGAILTKDRHYFQVQTTGNPTLGLWKSDSPTGPFIVPNGWWSAIGCPSGRWGLLLDLDDGSLRFFKETEGQLHEQPHIGYPAGTVTGPVTLAVVMFTTDDSALLISNATFPVGV